MQLTTIQRARLLGHAIARNEIVQYAAVITVLISVASLGVVGIAKLSILNNNLIKQGIFPNEPFLLLSAEIIAVGISVAAIIASVQIRADYLASIRCVKNRE